MHCIETFCHSDELIHAYDMPICVQAAKDVVLAEKPVISDDSNQLDNSLLDELLSNIATLASVYHKPPDAFVTRVKTAIQKPDDEEYPDGIDSGNAETSSPADNTAALSGSNNISYSSAKHPAAAPSVASPPVPDLLGDLMGLDNALVPADQTSAASE